MANITTSKSELKEISYVLDSFRRSERSWATVKDAWSRWDDLFFGVLPQRMEPDSDRSGLVPTDLYVSVQDFKSRLRRAHFSTPDDVDVMPTEGGDISAALAVKVVTNYRLYRDKFRRKFREVYDSIGKFGMGVILVIHESSTFTEPQFVPQLDDSGEILFDESGKPIGRMALVEESYNAPRTMPIPLWDYFPDPHARTPDQRTEEGFRRIVTIEELRSAGVYERLGKVKKEDFLGRQHERSGESDRLKSTAPGDIDERAKNYPVVVKELASIENGRLVVRTVANDKVLLRKVTNPYGLSEFYSEIVVADPRYRDLGGFGAIEMSEDTFYEIMIKHNQHIDNINLAIAGMLIAPLDANLPDNILAEPGRIWQMHNPEEFKHFPIPLNTQQAFQEIAFLKEEIKNTNRTNDYTRGANPGRRDTATGVMEMTANAEAGFAGLTESVGESIANIGEKFWKYDQLWGDDKELQRILGSKAPELRRYTSYRDLVGNYDFKFIVSSIASKGIQRQQALMLYDRIMLNPASEKREVGRRLAEIFEQQNLDELFPDPQKELRQAMRENIALQEGIMQPVFRDDDHKTHIQAHSELPEGVGTEHIQMHEKYLQLQGETVAQSPQLAQAGSGGELSNILTNKMVQPGGGER